MPQFRDYLSASQVMYGAALLLNDPEMTDYTYPKMLPYLNMAIYELNEHLVESSVPVGNQTSDPILIPTGANYIVNLPMYLMQVQEVAEREVGRGGAFIPLPRKEFTEGLPVTNSLLFWSWQNQRVNFNTNGANTPMEIQLKYINVALKVADDQNTVIGTTSATMYLIYRLAALLSIFIGENQTRAAILNEEAEKSLERVEGISNKDKQQIMTRHRPFRAAYKTRGW
jgi:hypothetical protein